MTDPGETLPRSLDTPPTERRTAALYVALHAHDVQRPVARHVLAEVDGVSVGRGDQPEVRTRIVDGAPWLEIRLADPRVSASHLRLTRVMHRWVAEDVGSRNGTFINGEAVRRAVLVRGDVIEVGQTFLVFLDGEPMEGELPPLGPRSRPGLSTLLPELGARFGQLARVAKASETVLIRGESGTGKELIAHALHDLSGRTGEFVAVNCGALPESMVEAELFGHKRGAFSGAALDRRGLVRSADGGTLFLDEIGDLRLESQAALLRVLQEKTVTPIGSDRSEPVDVRVVCATHQPLETRVADGEFRGDLFARVRGFTVDLPPLRARRADLGLLVAALLARHLPPGASAPLLSSSVVRAFFAYGWPYNVRELEKCVSTALTLAAGGPIRIEHLPEPLRLAGTSVAGSELPAATPPPGAGATQPPPVAPASAADPMPGDAQGQPRRERLVLLMREYQGNVAAVARVLGKGRTQIHRWLERYGINPDEYRGR
jgi:DNA-binding NtrC family response regulator